MKLKEITEYDIREGKYFAVGKPLVLEIKGKGADEESKFKKSLEECVGTVRIPQQAEFFLRGFSLWCARNQGDKFDLLYVPVQFYKTAHYCVTLQDTIGG